jgi:hypothetical protein
VSDDRELIEAGRKYADAIDKDRGFESGLTDCLRGLADALAVRADEVKELTSDVSALIADASALGDNLDKVAAERDYFRSAFAECVNQNSRLMQREAERARKAKP